MLRDATYDKESEAGIRQAKGSQIEYRTIEIRRPWLEEDQSEPGEPWFSYSLTPINKLTEKNLTISPWKPLPAKK